MAVLALLAEGEPFLFFLLPSGVIRVCIGLGRGKGYSARKRLFLEHIEEILS